MKKHLTIIKIFASLIALSLAQVNGASGEFCKTKLQKYYQLKVYQITLCKKENINYNEIFNSAFSIKLKYEMSSSSWWIGNRSVAEIERNYKLTKQERANYKKFFDGFFPSVQNGDEILLKFEPNSGAKFYLNGKFFGEITQIDFAKQVANIWLHPNSSFKETRNFLFEK